MPDTLIIGDYAYSSWSLRGWLLYRRFDLPVKIETLSFIDAEVRDQLGHAAPARTVPTVISSDGTVIWDSLAIAEELASRHPDANLWPADPVARATARCLTAEMHSGFAALREVCPMNLRAAYRDVPVSKEVRSDLDRIELLWGHALDRFDGPWLCGEYSVVDAFYAPVAARIAGYGLSVGEQAQTYVNAHLSDGAFRRWRALGLAYGADLPWYQREYAKVHWPGPVPITAEAVHSGPSENATCPYSGEPVTHFMRIDGRVFGFCNALCRDKTVADPEAWTAFMRLLNGQTKLVFAELSVTALTNSDLD